MQERWRALNEIDAGCMENLTYEEISEKFVPFSHLIIVTDQLSRYPEEPSYEQLLLSVREVREGEVAQCLTSPSLTNNTSRRKPLLLR